MSYRQEGYWHRLLTMLLVLTLVLGSMSGALAPGYAQAEPGQQGIITSAGKTTSWGGSKVQVDPNLILTLAEPTLDSATVMINNPQPGDLLQVEADHTGIEVAFKAQTGILTLLGSASVEKYQEVLRSVEFVTTSTEQVDRTVSFTLGNALPFSGNGHYYEYITQSSAITWENARSAAAQREHFGRQGYLVTISSAEENNFIQQKTLGIGWIGAKDISHPAGDWRWVTGPEGLMDSGKGLAFWKGYTSGGGNYGPVAGQYNNWVAGEPNNSSGEWVAHIFGPGSNQGQWNDFHPNNTSVRGYIVEYGGMPEDDTSVNISASKTVAYAAVDKEALQTEVDDLDSGVQAGTLNEEHYTTDSWGALQAQWAAANAVLAASGVTQAQVDKALSDLKQARAALVSKKPLQDRTEEIRAENLTEADYYATNWQQLQAALDAAELVLAQNDATKEQLAAALDRVNQARAGLVDKEALDNRALELKQLNPVNYYPENWQALEAALEHADAVLGRTDATQTEVDAALAALNIAREALVEKSALQTRVTELKPLNRDDYSPDNYEKLEYALEVAERVLADADATQIEVDDALGKLNAARANLVDYEALRGSVNRITEEALNAAHYTTGSWAELQSQLNAARSVLADSSATQREVDAAQASLDAARERLVRTLGLQQKAAVVKALNETDYYPENWSNLQSALADAEQILSNGTATQEDIDAALARLDEAHKGLVEKAALGEKVLEVEGLNETDYEPADWLALENALAEAHAALDNPNATQTAVDQAYAKLEAARVALVDKRELQAKQDAIMAEKLKAGTYTLATWEALEAALAEATRVLDKANATPAEVAAALSNLTEAREKLTLRPYYPSAPVVPSVSSGAEGSSGSDKQIIPVDVEAGAGNLNTTKVELERTTASDGKITDRVVFTPEKAKEAIGRAEEQEDKVVRIVIPDTKDEVSEVKVDVPAATVAQLKGSRVDVEIFSENGAVRVPSSSLSDVNGDLYFRLVPVKDQAGRDALTERAATEAVQKLAGSEQVRVLSRPVKVETNLQSREAELTLPLTGMTLPADAAERAAFLEKLAIYAELADGTQQIITPEIVTLANGEQGLRFVSNTFGVYAIVQLGEGEADHEPYIRAYPDGLFRPDQAVTRAEMASMLVRLNGLSKAETLGSSFADVSESHWASQTIAQASKAGLLRGYADGTFRAEGGVTRAEMAVIIFNQLKLTVGESPSSFSDVPANHWASNMIAAVQSTGLLPGKSDGRFDLDGKVTRAEAVTILNQLFDRAPHLEGTLEVWPDVDASYWAYSDIVEASTKHSYSVVQP